jgi:hypothetical protein
VIDQLSDEQCQRAADLKKKHGSARAAAKAAGLPRTTFVHAPPSAACSASSRCCRAYEIKRSSAQLDDAGNVQKEWVTQHKESGARIPDAGRANPQGRVGLCRCRGPHPHQWIKTKPIARRRN